MKLTQTSVDHLFEVSKDAGWWWLSWSSPISTVGGREAVREGGREGGRQAGSYIEHKTMKEGNCNIK